MMFGMTACIFGCCHYHQCSGRRRLHSHCAASGFAAGGVAALIVASLSVGLMGQWIVFIVFSALLLVLVRPLCRRFLGSRQQATNADRIIGQIAVVTEPIDNVLETGAVKINGKIWTARSTTDAQIAIGTRVTVVEIRGVKAIVKPNQL